MFKCAWLRNKIRTLRGNRSSDYLDQLPTKSMKSIFTEPEKESDKGKLCTICYSIHDIQDCSFFTCCHAFGTKCIDKYICFGNGTECPTCQVGVLVH